MVLFSNFAEASGVEPYLCYIKSRKAIILTLPLALEIFRVQVIRIVNQILIKSGCTAAAPLKDKLSAMKQLQNEYSTHVLCNVLEVNRATFYNYILRSPETTIIQQEDEEFRPLINEIFEKSGRRFGVRKIRAKLMENQYVISEKRTSRLMKEMGLSCQSNIYPNATNDRKYKYYPNKLKRQFLQEAPNLVWVTDITYLYVNDATYYLCVIIDLFSRKVVSHAISDKIDVDLVTSAFKEAFSVRNQPQGLMLHSDQGAQYTSYIFRSFLRKHHVKPSYSKPGVPFDNAVAESFFASIKKEFKRSYYTTEEELRTAVQNYLEYFNDYRPHQCLGFITPNQAESEYFEKQEKEKMLPGN